MTNDPPSRADLLALLRAHKSELEAEGDEAITLFGSVARGDASGQSDVDLVIRASPAFSTGGYHHFGRLEEVMQPTI